MNAAGAALTLFASDNYAGAHPAVLEAVAAANEGWAPAYGDDPWTARLRDRMRELFGDVEASRSSTARAGTSSRFRRSPTDRRR